MKLKGKWINVHHFMSEKKNSFSKHERLNQNDIEDNSWPHVTCELNALWWSFELIYVWWYETFFFDYYR